MGVRKTDFSRAGDRELAAKADQREAAGQKATARQQEARRRLARAAEEEARWKHYRSIPKKHWRIMAGSKGRPKADKVLNEQAERYGLPFGRAVIDLPAVVKALHAFLGRYGRLLAAAKRAGEHAGSIADSTRRIKAAEARRAERRDALEAGQVIPLEQHRAERMKIFRWAKQLAQRAGVELGGELIGATPAEVRRKVPRYFAARFRELVTDEGTKGRRDEGTKGKSI